MRRKHFFPLLLLLMLLCRSGSAQFFSVGVKAGVPLNDAAMDANSGTNPLTSSTDRYIVGPMAEIRLPFHLGVEADALYRHYTMAGRDVSEWQFPILAKYHFRGVPLLHPYAEVGPVFNHVSDIANFTSNQSTAGLALGAGLDFKFLFLHLSPEFRYLHWGDRNFDFAPVGSPLKSRENQYQFLVGFTL